MTAQSNGNWRTAAISALGALLLLALTLRVQELSTHRRELVRQVQEHMRHIDALERRVQQLEAKR